MKKKYFTVFLILFLSLNLFSQEKFQIGFRSGLTYSDYRGNSFVESNKPKLDYLIGGLLEYKFNSKFSIVFNLNYERKSIHYFYPKPFDGTIIGTPIGETPKKDPEIENLTRFQYISFPVLFKYYPISDSPFYLISGSYFASLIDVSNYNDNTKNDLNFNDNFRNLDIGLSIGLGYEFEMNKKTYLGLEIRDNFGLKELSGLTVLNLIQQNLMT